MKNTHIGYKILPKTVKRITPFDDESFLERNPDIKSRLTVLPESDEKAFRWQGTDSVAPIDLGGTFTMNEYSHFCFKVYNEKATGTKLRLRFNLLPGHKQDIQGGIVGRVIELDFEGLKEFRILRDQVTVAFPPPPFVSISIQASGETMNANIPENVVYFSEMTLEKDNIKAVPDEGVDVASPEHYECILDKFEEQSIGNADVWDSPQYLKLVENGNALCDNVWKHFKETWCDGEKGKLFGCDIQRKPWVDEPKIMHMYEKLLTMAKAYARPKSKYFKNAELLADIKNALEYMYKYYFGENLYTSTTYGNWWPWDIGIPMQYLPTLVLLRRELGRELVCKYASTVKFLMPFPYGSGSNMLNMAKNALIAGALLYDAEYICRTKYFLLPELGYFVDTFGADGGFYEDGSFIQHTNHPYIRGYGVELMSALTPLMSCTQSTPFEFTEKCAENQYRWVFENFRPMIFFKNFSVANAGRGATRGTSEISSLKELCRYIIYMRSYAPESIKPKFDSLIRRFMLNFVDDLSYSVWPCLAKYCYNLYRDDSVVPEGEYLTTRVFNRMARVAHHNVNYGAALNMSSDKIHKYESINGENQEGWYFSDGFLMLYPYKTGYDYDGYFFFFASPYLRPGVTSNTAERVAKCIYPSYPNASPYAGGVECGKYGSAGFILAYDESVMYHATHKDVKDTKITAKKSWFFFDNEIVCVGSGIKDASGTPVVTCVENRKWREGDALNVDGNVVTPTEKTEMGASYAYFTNMGGYVFFDKNTLTFKKASNGNCRKADDERKFDFLEILIEHGIGDDDLNGFYAYAYLPEQSAKETARYAENPDVEILSVTETAHAVYEKTLDMLAVNFFEAGKINVKGFDIETESVCSLIIKDGKVYVSDPTGRLDTINLSITVNGKSTEISANTANTAGKTFVFDISAEKTI